MGLGTGSMGSRWGPMGVEAWQHGEKARGDERVRPGGVGKRKGVSASGALSQRRERDICIFAYLHAEW